MGGGDGISVPDNFHKGISSWDKGPGYFRRLYHYNHRNSSDAFPEGTLGPYFIPQIPDLHQLFGIINEQSVCFKGIFNGNHSKKSISKDQALLN